MVDEAYAAVERQKARVDPMYHDKIDALVDRYARKLAENLNERNVIDARPEDMMKVRNLGRKSLEELLAKLKELGLQLNQGEE